MSEGSTTRNIGGSDRARIAPAGDLDLASAPALLASVEEAIQRTAATVVLIDLSSISFIDSTGLRALLDAQDSCAEHDRRLVLTGLGPQVRRLLDVVALADRFEIVDEMDHSA